MPDKKINLALPSHNGLFITATDTGVGKTLISGAIAKVLGDKGLKVGCFKPVATGCKEHLGTLVSSDAQFLKKYSNIDIPLETINPIRYKVPAAPLVSASAQGSKVDLTDITEPYRDICSKSDFVIVEGIGGLRVPLTTDIDLLNLACEFDLPVVLVTRPDLGTINHTLLSIDAVRNAGLTLAGVIVSGYRPGTKDIAHKTVCDTIVSCSSAKIIAIVPYDRRIDTDSLQMASAAESLVGVDFFAMGQKKRHLT